MKLPKIALALVVAGTITLTISTPASAIINPAQPCRNTYAGEDVGRMDGWLFASSNKVTTSESGDCGTVGVRGLFTYPGGGAAQWSNYTYNASYVQQGFPYVVNGRHYAGKGIYAFVTSTRS